MTNFQGGVPVVLVLKVYFTVQTSPLQPQKQRRPRFITNDLS